MLLFSCPLVKSKSHNDLSFFFFFFTKGVIDLVKGMLDVRTREKTHPSIVLEC